MDNAEIFQKNGFDVEIDHNADRGNEDGKANFFTHEQELDVWCRGH